MNTHSTTEMPCTRRSLGNAMQWSNIWKPHAIDDRAETPCTTGNPMNGGKPLETP